MPPAAGAWDADGPVPSRHPRDSSVSHPSCSIIADVCLCEYTEHGHCGIVHDESGVVVINDATIPLLGDAARSAMPPPAWTSSRQAQ
jgi:porphobilinogen synthase